MLLSELLKLQVADLQRRAQDLCVCVCLSVSLCVCGAMSKDVCQIHMAVSVRDGVDACVDAALRRWLAGWLCVLRTLEAVACQQA